VAKPIPGMVLSTNELRSLEVAGENVVAIALFVSLPYLLYWLFWLTSEWGLITKTPKEVERARKLRRAERVWALHAVCMMAVVVLIYIATMVLWHRHHPIGY
jgi:hypothetical protein